MKNTDAVDGVEYQEEHGGSGGSTRLHRKKITFYLGHGCSKKPDKGSICRAQAGTTEEKEREVKRAGVKPGAEHEEVVELEVL